ncbi:hypothetical protein F53441_136 [Fusarium austroafricanum]|uniref:Uncharacterized protein n=1 Tax=Fusarium austroafricanum TaxID=2364996 RepID=A0A8H4KWJ6_9HYPO|nr:hypothetical protein F53441_136 [Fusarium austroafricanum]
METTIDFIANLPVYEHEKPFFLHPSATAEEVDKIKTSNVQWDARSVTLHSMRKNPDISLEKSGFCYIQHESKHLPAPNMGSDAVMKYRQESEDLMRSFFNAEFVHCYDYKVRVVNL